ncbi:hypothetical protein [Methylobacterium sp. ID0610]|uniref:hypothetical protein n=1 Tax=Methylobacterium carpenticola TaxID=3344827 RepID=UPI0036CA7B8B
MPRLETLFYPDDTPSAPGWYETVHGWEVEVEGAFGDAHYWDGKTWLVEQGGEPARLPIFMFTEQPFASHEEAETYADANLGW